MFSINAQFDINTKKIWKGWVNIWGAVAPLAPPISAYGLVVYFSGETIV